MFVLSRKWCWSLLILLVALIAFPYFIFTYNFTALPANPGLKSLNVPIVRVVVAQTYELIISNNSEVQIDERERCMTEDECTRRIRQLQILYMEELPDIPFNFMIGDDGNIYDGRGFLFQGDIPRSNGSHILLNFALVIAFIGDYSEEGPSVNQTENFFRFLVSSAQRDMIDNNYVLWLDEDSPAIALNETLSESPHFVSAERDGATSSKPSDTTESTSEITSTVTEGIPPAWD